MLCYYVTSLCISVPMCYSLSPCCSGPSHLSVSPCYFYPLHSGASIRSGMNGNSGPLHQCSFEVVTSEIFWGRMYWMLWVTVLTIVWGCNIAAGSGLLGRGLALRDLRDGRKNEEVIWNGTWIKEKNHKYVREGTIGRGVEIEHERLCNVERTRRGALASGSGGQFLPWVVTAGKCWLVHVGLGHLGA